MVKRKKKSLRWQKVGAASLSVGQLLLDKLLELVELLPGPLETPNLYKRRLQGWPKGCSRHRLRQELARLKNQGWVIEAENNGKKFLRLSEKGKIEALHRQLRRIGEVSKKPWDGKWRLAIFDIPEKGRRERDAIRGTLKTVGFCQLQKSVYIYPYEIPGEMIAYLKEAKLLPFIRFARVDRMDYTDDLRKRFRL